MGEELTLERPSTALSDVSSASRMSVSRRQKLEALLAKEELKDAIVTRLQVPAACTRIHPHQPRYSSITSAESHLLCVSYALVNPLSVCSRGNPADGEPERRQRPCTADCC
jgi:hypothetical protein